MTSPATLNAILSPATLDDFLEAVRHRRFFHVEGDEARFASIMTWRSLNQLLDDHLHRLTYPILRVALGGLVLPESAITEFVRGPRGGKVRRLAPEKIREQVAAGGTVIVTAVENYLPDVRRLVDALRAEFTESIQANVYFSPGGADGFQVHFDTHDVIILQLEGSKDWDLYGISYPFPLEGQSYTNHQVPSGSAIKVNLTRGDALYIPRGCWHKAVARRRTRSLHLTIGLLRETRLDILDWLMERLGENPIMREDAASAFDPLSTVASIEVVGRCLSALLNDADKLADEYSRWRRARARSSRSILDLPV